jgi:hypothetical protein
MNIFYILAFKYGFLDTLTLKFKPKVFKKMKAFFLYFLKSIHSTFIIFFRSFTRLIHKF